MQFTIYELNKIIEVANTLSRELTSVDGNVSPEFREYNNGGGFGEPYPERINFRCSNVVLNIPTDEFRSKKTAEEIFSQLRISKYPYSDGEQSASIRYTESYFKGKE